LGAHVFKAQKESQIISVFFALSGSFQAKAACTTLVKSTFDWRCLNSFTRQVKHHKHIVLYTQLLKIDVILY